MVKGTAVQVSKQEDGSWRYGVKLSELDEENKASYFQMLYDRDHSLAKQMGKSVSIFEDVFLNIHRRAERGTQSRRALPRVDSGAGTGRLVTRRKGARTWEACNLMNSQRLEVGGRRSVLP